MARFALIGEPGSFFVDRKTDKSYSENVEERPLRLIDKPKIEGGYHYEQTRNSTSVFPRYGNL